MKKTLALVLALIMLFSVLSCSEGLFDDMDQGIGQETENEKDLSITKENAKESFKAAYEKVFDEDAFAIYTDAKMNEDTMEAEMTYTDGDGDSAFISKVKTTNGGESVHFGKGKAVYSKYSNEVYKSDLAQNVSKDDAMAYADFESMEELFEGFFEKNIQINKKGKSIEVSYTTHSLDEFVSMLPDTDITNEGLRSFKGYLGFCVDGEGYLSEIELWVKAEYEQRSLDVSTCYKIEVLKNLTQISTPDWVLEYEEDDKKLISINPFDYVEVTFDGMDGEGKALLYTNLPSEIAGSIHVTLSDYNKNTLSNGDSVTVKASFNEKILKDMGYRITQNEKTYTVEGLFPDPQEHEKNNNETPKVSPPSNGVITTADELHAVLVNGDPAKNWSVTAKSLDMSGKAWRGMENFSGTFDFGGCVITNASYPLFRSVKGGTVKNLTVSNSRYFYTNEEAYNDTDVKTGQSFNHYYSPVVCYAANITVENVKIEKSVTVKADFWKEDSYVAGIVACAEGRNIRITDCAFYGNVATDSLNVCFGGIAGKIVSDSADSLDLMDYTASKVLIYNCHNSGSIIDLAYGNDSKVAGVVGWVGNGAVVKCTNYGVVESNDGGQAAGVVGYLSESVMVSKCLNTGNVYGGTGYVGGIVGYSNGTTRWIERCINTGIVSSNNAKYVGGIIGLAKKEEQINACYNLRSVCEVFCCYMELSGNIAKIYVPTENGQYANIKLTLCDSLDDASTIVNRINNYHPGTYTLTDDMVAFK